MTELLENIGHNIRRLRDERGWNQTELGFHADTSPSIISLIENGKRNPSTATLAKIAGALGVEVVDLFPKAQVPLPLEESAAGAPLLAKVLDAARRDAKKNAQASNRLHASEGMPQSGTNFAEDEVRTDLRNLGFPNAFFEDLLWPLAERVAKQNQRIIELERQLEAKEGEPAERLGTDMGMRQ
jgi:transcriptional regulator with XRE-family HTH domain